MDENTTANMDEFPIPEFLEDYTTENIYETMRDILPEDIDSSEGSHTWNLLMPTAMIVAEMCEYVLPQVIQLVFPEWSYGEYLDAHAQTRGMTRKAATPATGEITITGIQGTYIPEGSVFSTASLNEEDPSISYETTEDATIPASTEDPDAEESVTVPVECAEAGTAGNAAENTIIFVASDITGITAVTNANAIAGGTDEETDEALIARIVEYDQTQGDSFVGNVYDYRRWAMSVAGVGAAYVTPAQDDSGMVTIVLTDTNGDPASETLCTNVYDYIMSPDDPNARLAPVNATITVLSPTTVDIGVKATVELEAEAELEDVSAAFLADLSSYMVDALDDQEIKITRVAAILSATTGVNDFSDLQIGRITGGTATYGDVNIALTSTELPVVLADNITLTEGTVE